MSERTLYERVECPNPDLQGTVLHTSICRCFGTGWLYVPLKPNPLDEVERLKAEIVCLSDGPSVDEWAE